jgi:alkylated DNA repair dioxygenase AlkB
MAAQPSLFESTDNLLTDDERGRIVYTAGFVDDATARVWFDELRNRVEWRAQRRMMYEREVDVPRLMASFRLDQADATRLAAIADAAARVIERLKVRFNSVGLNLYRDGRDSVAPHNDHLNEIEQGCPIALVSLGATRRMTIRAKEPPKRVLHVDLEPGSLFVMDYATQLHYTHGVAKTTEPVGERISLAFRVRQMRESDWGSDRGLTPHRTAHAQATNRICVGIRSHNGVTVRPRS